MGRGAAAARESQEPNRQPDAWLGAQERISLSLLLD